MKDQKNMLRTENERIKERLLELENQKLLCILYL